MLAAAWENLALQGETEGLVTHGMQGFDYDKAQRGLLLHAKRRPSPT